MRGLEEESDFGSEDISDGDVSVASVDDVPALGAEEAVEGADPAPSGSDGSSDESGAESDGDAESDDAAEYNVAPRARAEKPRPDPALRNSNRSRTVVVVPPAERITDSRLHTTEAAQLIAMRAQQIAHNGIHYSSSTGLVDPVEFARAELTERRCPLKLRREVGTGPGGERIVEEWVVNEMALPPRF